MPRPVDILTSRTLRSLELRLEISVAMALWSAVKPPIAKDSCETPGIDAILAPSLEAFALALVCVIDFVVSRKITSCLLIRSATGVGGSIPFSSNSGIIINKTRDVASEEASYIALAILVVSVSVTISTFSCSLTSKQDLTTVLAEMRSSSSVNSTLSSPVTHRSSYLL